MSSFKTSSSALYSIYSACIYWVPCSVHRLAVAVVDLILSLKGKNDPLYVVAFSSVTNVGYFLSVPKPFLWAGRCAKAGHTFGHLMLLTLCGRPQDSHHFTEEDAEG